jgi:acyl carrier protein
MTREEILHGVEAVAEQHLRRPGPLRPEMDLVEDLELDSLLLLTLAVEVENHFRIVLEEEDEMAIRTVGDLVHTIGHKVAADGR